MLLIYLPAAEAQGQSSPLAALAGVGLAELAGGAAPQTHLTEHGPAGRGVFYWWPSGPKTGPDAKFFLPAYDPAAQLWRAGPATEGESPRWWFGWPHDDPPTPAQLLRPNAVPGAAATLADGQIWQLPTPTALPKIWGQDASGQWIGQARPEYAAYCEASGAMFARIVAASLPAPEPLPDDPPAEAPAEETAGKLTIAEVLNFLVQSLAVNYRLNGALVGALGLLDDNVILPAVEAALELDKLRQWEGSKKNGPQTPAG